MAKYILIILFGLSSINVQADNKSEVEQILFQLETKVRLDKLEDTQKGLERTQKSLENLQKNLEGTLQGLQSAQQQLYTQLNKQNATAIVPAQVGQSLNTENYLQKHKDIILVILIVLALLSLIMPLIWYFKNRHLQKNVEYSQEKIILMQESVKGILAEMQKMLDSILFAKSTAALTPKTDQPDIQKHISAPQMVTSATNSSALSLIQLAQNAYGNNNFAVALSQVDKAIIELKRQVYDPNLAEALYLKGSILMNQEQFKSALKSYDDLISIFLFHKSTDVQIQVAKALRSKAMMLVKLGKLEQAVKACDELIFQFTDRRDLSILNEVANAWCNKSIILVQLNQLDLAIQASNILTEQFSHYDDDEGIQTAIANAWYNKGAALVHLNQLDQAKTTLNELTEKFSSNESADIQQIITLAKQAISYLEEKK